MISKKFPNKRWPLRRENLGVTLIELLIVLAVGAILVTTAVPGMRQLIDNNRSTAYVNSLVGAMHLARSEAIKRNSNVAVCASSDGLNCGGDWSEGWMVFDSINAADNPLGVGAQTFSHLQEIASDADQLIYDGEGVPVASLKIQIGADGISPRTLEVSMAGSVKSRIEGH